MIKIYVDLQQIREKLWKDYIYIRISKNRKQWDIKGLQSLHMIEQYCVRLNLRKKRAMLFCPNMDPENMYWKAVATLLEKHADVSKNMDVNTRLKDNYDDKGVDEYVTDFLNQASPKKIVRWSIMIFLVMTVI